VGHDDGLSVLFRKTGEVENYLYGEGSGRGLSNRSVYDMWDDGEKIWIGTFGGGVNVLNKYTKQISYLTSANGLCNDAIYTVVPYNDSLLWLGTNKGLSVLNIHTGKFRNYQKNDGMPSEEFNMLSEYVDDKGEVYMGTMSGVISFNPLELNKNLLVPGVYLSRIRKNGTYLSDSATTVVNRERRIVAKYGEDLFLEFSPMTFHGVNEPELSYKIREAGNEWRSGESKGLLPLIKFEPGEYTIDVKMKSYSGSETSKIWTLYVKVLPPFWKTLGFRVLATVFSLLMAFLIIRAYISRRLERQRVEFLRQQAVEQERSRISAELHDDIGGGLTAIRLLSEMGLETDTQAQVPKYLQRISDSSNELIQKMNEIVWALNVNNDSLQSLIAYTRQYAVSYLDDLQIDCHFETPDEIPDIPVNGKNRRSIFLLVKESLNNVVKHAEADHVDIKVGIDGALHIQIADNGKGFNPSGRLGNGLNNMRRRVQNLKGVMDIRNGQGTTVRIEIPVRNLNT
jgi:signal transduction histidine kinase